MPPKRSHFDPTATFTSLRGLSHIITFCGIVNIVELVIVMAMQYLDNWALMHYQLPSSHLHPFFDWYLANQDLFTLLYYGGMIVFLLWIYQAYRNLYALDQETEVTPGNVVAGCIFPIANLYVPYVRMRELWQKVIDANNWQLVKTWWGSFILGVILYYIPRFIFPYADLEHLTYGKNLVSVVSVTTFFYTAAALSLIAFYAMALRLVQAISKAEAEKLLSLPATKADHSQALLPGQIDPESTGKTGIGTKITFGIIGVTIISVIVLILVYVLYLAFPI